MTHGEFEARIDALMARVDQMGPDERLQKARALRMAAMQLNLAKAAHNKVIRVADALESYK